MKCSKCGRRLFSTLDGAEECVICDVDNTPIPILSSRKIKAFKMNSDKDLEDYFKIIRDMSKSKGSSK